MGRAEPLTLPLEEQLSYSLRREQVDAFLARQLATLPAGSRLLDIGGVKHGQRGRSHAASQHLAVTTINIVSDKGLDIKADAARLPLASHSYPAILCSEVLEHVANPGPVLAEIQRVLAPGGVALLTVPFLFRQHGDPTDYGRYTEWFWAEQLQTLGFTNSSIEKQGLFGSVLADMLRHWGQQRLYTSRGLLNRPRRWLLPRLMAAARRHALRFDVQHAQHPVWSSYVGGFGIRTHKLA